MPSSAYYSGPESPPNPVCSTWPNFGGSRPCKVPWTGNRSRPELEPTYTKCDHKSKSDLGLHTKKYSNQALTHTSSSFQHSKAPAEYASPVWNPYTQTNINKIETVQRRAACWVTLDYSSYSSVTQMINTLGWRSLEQRRAEYAPIYFYTDPYISKLLKILILSFGNCALEQPPFLGCPF